MGVNKFVRLLGAQGTEGDEGKDTERMQILEGLMGHVKELGLPAEVSRDSLKNYKQIRGGTSS